MMSADKFRRYKTGEEGIEREKGKASIENQGGTEDTLKYTGN